MRVMQKKLTQKLDHVTKKSRKKTSHTLVKDAIKMKSGGKNFNGC